ncbi:GFA family protein [Rhizobium wuzhouense]|uniref:Aldehyde-activating protein n=1 Tax=Rhizobium wuzhouense TaxID=1986026 RepID=A0ABX5NXD4_9HYPH|nr:GFA family protein [Rhizobium wuzhouense]PYB77799.1 aldehyde-activating protein [Rhizobium wuzhouense]
MRITGACHCGAVRYEAEIEPQRIGICHCTDCQRLTGSAYRVTAAALPDRFRLLCGIPRRYRKLGDSGQPSDQFFCGDCGSPLWRESADGKIGIRLGTIDQRLELKPHHQSWLGSALPFVFDISGLERQEDS